MGELGPDIARMGGIESRRGARPVCPGWRDGGAAPRGCRREELAQAFAGLSVDYIVPARRAGPIGTSPVGCRCSPPCPGHSGLSDAERNPLVS